MTPTPERRLAIPVTDPALDAPDGAVVVFPNGARYERIGGAWEALEECTGITAAWCPLHGDCSCPDPADAMDHPSCPLHAVSSPHGEFEWRGPKNDNPRPRYERKKER